MRPVHLVSRAVASIVLAGVAGGLAVTAAAADDDLTVTVDGVSYRDRDQRDHEDRVGYSIRSLEGWRYEWLTEPMTMGRAGDVAFSQASATMPDGYCVVYVRVPGVGEWHEHSGGARCTGERRTSQPSAPAPSTPSAPTPTEAPEPTPTSAEPTPAEEDPTPSPTPSPSASPTPSPSPSRSASPSASASPSPTASTASPSAAGLGDPTAGAADQDGEPGDSDLWSAQERLLDGDAWAAIGLGLAAVGVAVGGAVAWRARHLTD
ncbi:hypothetical protein [Isoptericola sp. AK164]|uniref:hypothetical protein n=1 Tax=Isoptericola sp. AK164 TaxID=3024246 RepID=UPI0024182B65|nr:hypothetical protein [Isoptericola sp. AK164]